jgi:hypothetical protein
MSRASKQVVQLDRTVYLFQITSFGYREIVRDFENNIASELLPPYMNLSTLEVIFIEAGQNGGCNLLHLLGNI